MANTPHDQPTTVEQAALVLLSLVGAWEGTNRTWFEPGKLADESPIHGVVRQLTGSQYVIYEYHSTIQGQPFSGQAVYGFNQFTKQFESSWIDSFHMSGHMMLSRGSGTSDGFQVLGEFLVPDGPAWGWRTLIQILNHDELNITAYIISPQGEESKAVETSYRRK